jgi:hypothetical protein
MSTSDLETITLWAAEAPQFHAALASVPSVTATETGRTERGCLEYNVTGTYAAVSRFESLYIRLTGLEYPDDDCTPGELASLLSSPIVASAIDTSLEFDAIVQGM